MRNYCRAQETLLGALWGPTWDRNPQKERRCVCVQLTHFAAETNTTLESSYIPIKNNFKKEKLIKPLYSKENLLLGEQKHPRLQKPEHTGNTEN